MINIHLIRNIGDITNVESLKNRKEINICLVQKSILQFQN